MKINEKLILSKDVVGQTEGGEPVLLVVTHGGLYAFFAKNDSGIIETLSMAPQVAIGAWMAEKKKKIKWNDGFLKSEEYRYEELKKSEREVFNRLRGLMMSPTVKSEKLAETDYYYIYDTGSFEIGIMHKEDIKKSLKKVETSDLVLVRHLTLDEPLSVIRNHKEFSDG